jgi:hypothetical protein
MKKQNKLNIKIQDLEPLNDVWAGRHHRRHGRGRAVAFRDLELRRELLGEYKGVRGLIGYKEIP